MTTDRNDELIVEHIIRAPLESVWEAWTTEAGLASWWWAGWEDTTYRVDLRVGGAYRISAPSAGIAVSGEYAVIEPPRHLAMTWIWEDDGGEGPVERVEVDLTGTESETNVRIRHTGPWTTPEPAADYARGWEHVLGSLAERSGRL